jgi:hypothetical protein
MQPPSTATILDIGASDVDTLEANTLEKNYPYPDKITCGVIGDATQLRAMHPQITVAPIVPGERLPFADRSFDIAYSNAVIEHVGGAKQRRFFVEEMLRVAHSIFIIAPNAWFPVEHHTSIPLLHYTPTLFRRAVRGTMYDHWSRIENLDFITKHLLTREWPGDPRPRTGYVGLPLGMFSSNIAVWLCRPKI